MLTKRNQSKMDVQGTWVRSGLCHSATTKNNQKPPKNCQKLQKKTTKNYQEAPKKQLKTSKNYQSRGRR